MTKEETQLPRSMVMIYGALGFPLALLGYPLGVWLPRAYGTDVGIELYLIGAIISAAAIFDAITDPLIGFASDRFRSRWGRRRSWIGIGLPLLTLATWNLLSPGSTATATYLAVWYIALRVGSTLVLVPYGAWGAELSSDYHDRTRLNSSRQKWILFGLIGAALIPAGVEFLNNGASVPALEVLDAFAWAVLLTLPLSGALLLARVPEPPALPGEGRTPFLRSLRLMWKNGLFRRVVTIELVITGGEYFTNTLSLFFMQDFIGIRSPGQLYLIYFTTGLLAMPAWDLIASRWGKHRSLACAMVLVSGVSISIFFLNHGDILAFYILFAAKGFCFGAFAYLPLAMLADVVDIDTMRSGDARTGGYFAVHGFMTKCAASFGGLSLPLLALAGYSATSGAQNDDTALLWLGILYALVPTVLFVFAFWLTWTWPLSAARHARMRATHERIAGKRAPGRNSRQIVEAATARRKESGDD
jgi:Na+/melibiose symporter-like transporter